MAKDRFISAKFHRNITKFRQNKTDIQEGNAGHAARTYSTDMQQQRAACVKRNFAETKWIFSKTCSMDMQI
jgi:hypothetical protein